MSEDKTTVATTDNQEVGYGRPPKQYQFKKGQSGNLKGRPKRKPSKFDLRAIARDELFKAVTVVERGKKRKMPLVQVLLRKELTAVAAGGSASKFLLQILRWLMQNNDQVTTEDSIQDILSYRPALTILPGSDIPKNPIL